MSETPDRLTLTGNDNSGKPRQLFADKLAAADDEAFVKIAEEYIWLSSYAANNRRSDYHWMCAACDAEANRRGKPGLFGRAYDQARATM